MNHVKKWTTVFYFCSVVGVVAEVSPTRFLRFSVVTYANSSTVVQIYDINGEEIMFTCPGERYFLQEWGFVSDEAANCGGLEVIPSLNPGSAVYVVKFDDGSASTVISLNTTGSYLSPEAYNNILSAADNVNIDSSGTNLDWTSLAEGGDISIFQPQPDSVEVLAATNSAIRWGIASPPVFADFCESNGVEFCASSQQEFAQPPITMAARTDWNVIINDSESAAAIEYYAAARDVLPYGLGEAAAAEIAVDFAKRQLFLMNAMEQ